MQHEEGIGIAGAGPRAPGGRRNLAAGRADLQSALAIFQAIANSYEAARTLYHLARVELAAGCPAAAAEALDSALATFTALGARHDQTLAERLIEQHASDWAVYPIRSAIKPSGQAQ